MPRPVPTSSLGDLPPRFRTRNGIRRRYDGTVRVLSSQPRPWQATAIDETTQSGPWVPILASIYQPTAEDELKQRVRTVINDVPQAALAEVVSFAEARRPQPWDDGLASEPNAGVGFEGLWEGVVITDEDIVEARRETWSGFGERDL